MLKVPEGRPFPLQSISFSSLSLFFAEMVWYTLANASGEGRLEAFKCLYFLHNEIHVLSEGASWQGAS